MNKVEVKNIGYDFNPENIKTITELNPYERLKIYYILPNYSQLEKTRIELAKVLGGISTNNIMTFDDLVDKYAPQDLNYISREEAAWIIKKIISSEEVFFSKSIGTAREIRDFIFDLKSNRVNKKSFKDLTQLTDDLEIISYIYDAYESFLEDKKLEDEIGKYLLASKRISDYGLLREKLFLINGFIEFRPHELILIKSLIKNNNKIKIQYPFYTKRENLKVFNSLNKLKDLDFIIEVEDKLLNDQEILAYNIFSDSKLVFDNKYTIISASNKYYELKEVFSLIKERYLDNNLEDISIIITEEYEELIEKIAKEYNIRINIMNEEKAKNLPLIFSVLNLLQLIKEGEKRKLISFLLDNNFNEKFREDQSVILQDLRALDYKNIFTEYKDISDECLEFLNYVRSIVTSFKIEPIEYLNILLSSKRMKEITLKAFDFTSDHSILSSSMKAIEILEESIENVIKFSNIVSLTWEEVLDILIDMLLEGTYYSNNLEKGVQVLKDINSIGLKSKVRFVCGLNPDFPSLSTKTYLYNEKFKNIYYELGMEIGSQYEEFNNKVLLFSQVVANSEELIFSYIYSEAKLKDNKSILLEDLLNRVQKESLNFIDSSSMLKSSITKSDNPLSRFIYDVNNKNNNKVNANYFSLEKANLINNILGSYYNRKNMEGKFWGVISSYNFSDHVSSYSPTMVDNYNTCPFMYLLKYIYKYEPVDLDYVDDFHKNKGNFYHLALEYFFKNYNYLSASDFQLLEYIENSINFALVEINENDVTSDLQKNILTNILFNYIQEDIKYQKQLENKFKPSLFEEKVNSRVKNINLYGRIDRLDISPEGDYILIDYKSKNKPSITEVLNYQNLQLPLYSLILGRDKLAGLFYGVIESDSGNISKVIFDEEISPKDRSKGKLTKGELDEYLDLLVELLLKIDNKITKGDFIVNPIDSKVCTYCDYSSICRKEELNNEI